MTIVCVQPDTLVRVSSYEGSEPHFGTSGVNRFDAWDGSFGSCYLVYDLVTALAVSLLHDRMPDGGKYQVTVEDLLQSRVHHFVGPVLCLANLTGACLNLLGGHGELSGTPNYQLTQSWAMAIYEHRVRADGFIYMSRLNNCEQVVVLFDHGGSAQMKSSGCTPLTDHPNYTYAKKMLQIIEV